MIDVDKTNRANQIIAIGKIGRPRGLNGDLYITPETDFPERFLDLKEIFVHTNKEWKNYNIVSSRLLSGRPLIKFEAVNNAESARRLTNCSVGVDKTNLVSLPGDTFFLHQLIGCKVFNFETSDEIGEIVDVEQYPANDVYLIKDKNSVFYRMAAVKDFVKEINMQDKTIMIDASGLVNENTKQEN